MAHPSRYLDSWSRKRPSSTKLSHPKHQKEALTFLAHSSWVDSALVTQVLQRPDREILVVRSSLWWESQRIETTSRGHVIGDRVSIDSQGVYQGVYKRMHTLQRMKGDNDRLSLGVRREQVIAANIDVIVVVASVVDPHFQPGFLDRYLLLAEYCQIPVIIALTKTDMGAIPHDLLRAYEKDLSIQVFLTAKGVADSLLPLQSYLSDKVAVLVGKSGVGKSTLTNSLLGSQVALEGSVSRVDHQWKHTTTGSRMYPLKSGGYIIDTPGIRSLDFLELERSDIRHYMRDIARAWESCRYRWCLHCGEEGCALPGALRSGDLSSLRYESYQRLLKECIK